MATPVDDGFRNLAARHLRRQVKVLNDHAHGARTAEDIEDVHQARVASRRLRAALRMFCTCFPDDNFKRWRRETRRITRSLGRARDLDVHLEYVRSVLSDIDDKSARAGVRRLLLRLRQARDAVQPKVVKDLDRLEATGVLGEMYACAERMLFEMRPIQVSVTSSFVFERAREHILKRLATLLEYEECIEDPAAVKTHHKMRIAAKRLRYTMELCKPAFDKELDPFIKCVKRIQTLLGDVHDRDVWMEELRAFPDEERRRMTDYFGHTRPFYRLDAGIEHLALRLHEERVRIFNEARGEWHEYLGTQVWQKLRELLEAHATQGTTVTPVPARAGDSYDGNAEVETEPPEDPPSGPSDDREKACLRAALELAESCHYEQPHSHQVTRLALQLFDELRPLHEMRDEDRFILHVSGLLHDIGWLEGQKGHHKTAMKLILDAQQLPLDDRERCMVALIARYHRKALPGDRHAAFAELSAPDQHRVRVLAGILRVADGLDRSHLNVVRHVSCECPAGQIVLRGEVTGPAHFEKWAALKKSDLLESVFGRKLLIDLVNP